MNDLVLPETRYALSGDVSIAYQTMGAGPVDIIIVQGLASHVEFMHEMPVVGLWRAFAPLSGARPPLDRSSSK
jgi:hypothetical protein